MSRYSPRKRMKIAALLHVEQLDIQQNYQQYLLSKESAWLAQQAIELDISCIWWMNTSPESRQNWTHYASVVRQPFFHVFN